MLKKLTIIGLVGVASMLNAIEPKWNLNGLHLYDPKEVISQKDSRDVIYLISSKTCSHCRSFIGGLNNLSIKEKAFINKNYMLAAINVQDAPQIVQLFNVRITPSIYILDRKSKEIVTEPIEGEPEITSFVEFLKDVKRDRK